MRLGYELMFISFIHTIISIQIGKGNFELKHYFAKLLLIKIIHHTAQHNEKYQMVKNSG